MTPRTSPTVLIVDDDPPTCQMITEILVSSEIEVVGVAHDGSGAVQLASEVEPTIVLLDLSMPGEIDGMSALSLIKDRSPETLVVILTGHRDPRLVREAINRGASGFVSKTDQYRKIPEMVKNLHRGDIAIVEPDLIRKAVSDSVSRRDAIRDKQILLKELTPREKTVLELIARGYDNQKIAKKLFISYNTVKSHTRKIYDKLSVPDRTQAALIAHEAGLDNGTAV